ncbi:MAG: MBL fold metallo-hydrolase [Spirochaetes bacterium]|jgi:glyoxylase-like metal-dependent hydrolase (beta-lactamase superfamily II)|nr:MBL fold metallo-hydrolase [Spirochaetota bacterium]
MIIREPGMLAPGLRAAGNMIFPGYLLTGKKTMMFDTGISAMGPVYCEELDMLNITLDTVLITHAHFDHIGGAAYLKKRVPGLKIGASPRMRDVLTRPRVIRNIEKILSEYDNVYSGGRVDKDAAFGTFGIDIDLKDGMIFDLGDGITVEAIETPGHTPECCCFYIPHIKAIISGEALGMPDEKLNILPEFLSSYDDYMNSLRKMVKFDVRMILLPHGAVLTEEHAADYISRSIDASDIFKDKILHAIKTCDGDMEKVIEVMSEDPVAKAIGEQQGRSAFLLNLRAQIKTVAESK